MSELYKWEDIPCQHGLGWCQSCASEVWDKQQQIIIDSLKSQLASSQERIEKLESALKRIGISAEYLSSNVNFQSDTLDSIINIAREALGPT